MGICAQAASRLSTTFAAHLAAAARPHPHKSTDPINQVSYTRKGKSSSKFVKEKDLLTVRKQLKNYERMKLLIERWIDLATELSTVRLTKETR